MDLSAMGVGDIVQLIGALGLGSAGGWVSGGVSAVWKAKHDRQTKLDEERRKRIAKWRLELTDPENRKVPSVSLPVFHDIYPHMTEMWMDKVEKLIGDDAPGVIKKRINGRSYSDYRMNDELLELVAQLEKDWHLL